MKYALLETNQSRQVYTGWVRVYLKPKLNMVFFPSSSISSNSYCPPRVHRLRSTWPHRWPGPASARHPTRDRLPRMLVALLPTTRGREKDNEGGCHRLPSATLSSPGIIARLSPLAPPSISPPNTQNGEGEKTEKNKLMNCVAPLRTLHRRRPQACHLRRGSTAASVFSPPSSQRHSE